MSVRVIVIGGGAAGLMAAGRAAECGARVLLLEKNRHLGVKLAITGKGRCNLTNACTIREFIPHLMPNGNFMRNGLARFFVDDTRAFFARWGVPTVVERGNRVFPASNRAADVVSALRRYAEKNGVILHTSSVVRQLLVADNAVWAVELRNGDIHEADRVILATGGVSYPQTGSTGDGFGMVEALGHTVHPPRPGLVPLVTREAFVPRLQGLSLRNVRATVYRDNKRLASEFGEMLFTHFGVSGPIILTLSSRIMDALDAGPLRLSIDLKPALDHDALDNRLQRDLSEMGRATYHRLLSGLLPRSMVEVFAEQTGLSLDHRLSHFTAQQRRRVIESLKRFDLTILRPRPIAEAIVTQGGVDCKEIDPKTMASRIVQGLHLAGEIIDVAGDTGGYNLQVAFTTGYLAGEACGSVTTDGRG